MAKENKSINACYLYSKANHAIRIQYDGETVFVPAFASRIKIADESKLGQLPDAIRKVSIPSKDKQQIKKGDK